MHLHAYIRGVIFFPTTSQKYFLNIVELFWENVVDMKKGNNIESFFLQK